jgi:hypothetical protein
MKEWQRNLDFCALCDCDRCLELVWVVPCQHEEAAYTDAVVYSEIPKSLNLIVITIYIYLYFQRWKPRPDDVSH